MQSVLIIGPTGVLGLSMCRALIENRQHFTRIAAFNNTSTDRGGALKSQLLAAFKAGGMEIVDGQYDDPQVFKGFDCVVMALGNHGLHLQPQIIDTAVSAGVRHFYPSEFGADLTVGTNWTQRYYKYKSITRDHLQAQKLIHPDLGWTYIVVGRFTEYSVIKHFGVDNVNAKAKIVGNPSKRQSLIGIPDIMRYFIASLRKPITPGEHRHYRIHGSSPTWDEIFKSLENITGRKYEVTYVPIEDALEREARAKATNDVDLELEASHQLVQGQEGTLLPEPYDNAIFPEVPQPASVDEIFKLVWEDKYPWKRVQLWGV